MAGEREYDVVLFGATGFTGGLTAEYLAAHGPADLRWALAGRNRAKLEAVAARLAAGNVAQGAPGEGDAAPRETGGPQPPALLEADAAVYAALARIAESTKVVITTVGP